MLFVQTYQSLMFSQATFYLPRFNFDSSTRMFMTSSSSDFTLEIFSRVPGQQKLRSSPRSSSSDNFYRIIPWQDVAKSPTETPNRTLKRVQVQHLSLVTQLTNHQ
ncbi:hypothetical protein KQX54_019701 [Cotesia glomerata]|uniref:Uncharacterized protein n=1 Tax=Cotesia glomerata TaxID=32391 RepID=A0AAV7J0R7_COTGL|nr:hypothetical protein KQX54_019701 [Cotesia glomerata]